MQPTFSSGEQSAGLRHYIFLDGLRGLVAVYVMIYHLLAWVPSSLPTWLTRLQKPISFGHVAVSIFIVLSGYTLGLPVARSTSLTLRQGYFRRRALRILPAYIAAFLLSLLVSAMISHPTDPGSSESSLTSGSVITHLLLIHNLFIDYAGTINMAHWSVAAEWQIYFLYPLLLIPAWRRFGTASMVLVGFLLAAAPIILLPASHNLSWTCPWYIGLFSVGVTASTYEFRTIAPWKNTTIIASVSLLAATYLFIHVRFRVEGTQAPATSFLKDSVAGISVALTLVYIVGRVNAGARPTYVRLLESPSLRLLGNLSYSLYLIHCAILTVCLAIASRYGMSDIESFALRGTLGVAGSMFAAALMYHLIERPFLALKAGRMRREAINVTAAD